MDEHILLANSTPISTSGIPKTRRTIIDSYNATVSMAPRYGFGTSERPGLLEESCTPGPGAYIIKSTMTKNFYSTYRSPPSFSMRGREKFGTPHLKACDKTSIMEPGPGAYKIPNIAGNERRPPSYSFPRSGWSKSMACINGDISPGPGEYPLPSSVGKQVLSNMRSNIGPKFGTGNRPPLVSITVDNVGPGDYKIPGGIGHKQIDSRKTSRCGSRFAKPGGPSKAPKDSAICQYVEEDFNYVPGAGSYNIPSTLCKNPCSSFKNPPVARMSGREKFGSPFASG